MKHYLVGALVALACAAAVFGAWSRSHPRGAAAKVDAEPVAQVRTESPRVQSVARTLDAIGDVAAGQTAGLSFARAGQLTELKVVVGARVAKGAILATLTPDPATKQAWQQAVDAVDVARRERQRQQELLASHLATQSQLDAADKTLRDAQGALKALEEQGGGSATSRLMAPFDAVVTNVTALQGDRIAAGAPVLQLGRADLLRVTMGIEPADRALVHRGSHVALWPATGADASRLDLGVNEVQDTVDPKTQLIDVVALVPPGLSNRLAPGMKVRAQLEAGGVTALAVARNAVLTDERGDYLFQVVGGKAHRVAVTRTLDNGNLVAIAGLQDLKSPIVVEGNYELEDGMAVKVSAP